MKTLIVGEDFTGRRVPQRRLAGYGETHIAVNGPEAVDAFSGALASGKPDELICLDIMMPEPDGQCAARRIGPIDLFELGRHLEKFFGRAKAAA